MKDIELIGSPSATASVQPRLVYHEGVAYYVVQPGDTVWGVAADLWGNGRLGVELWWAQPSLFRTLRGNMNNIKPGDVLRVPQGVAPMRMMGVGLVGAAGDVPGTLPDASTLPQSLVDATNALVSMINASGPPTGFSPVVQTFQREYDAYGGFGQLPKDTGGRTGEDGLYGQNTANAAAQVMAAMGSGPAPAPSPLVGPAPSPSPAPPAPSPSPSPIPSSGGSSFWKWLGIAGLVGLGAGGIAWGVHHASRR